jgi:penicillin-binding protein 1A
MKLNLFKYYKNNKKLFKLLFLLFISVCIFSGGIIYFFYQESYKKFPILSEKIPVFQKTQEIKILDSNNHNIPYSLKVRKIYVNEKDIPKKLIKTLIAVEDRNFFHHKGISIIGTLRSILFLPLFILLKKRPWGASTITQQLVKNLFLTMKYSYLRKIREIILSFRIEKQLTKQEILTLYLNMIYFGQGIYGIGTAAKAFFNKSLKELLPEEIAFLIGIIKNPNFSSQAFYEDSLIRRNFVLNSMVQNNIINQEYYDLVVNNPINYFNYGNDMCLYGQSFIDEILKKTKKILSDNNNSQIIIKSTMNVAYQKIAESILKKEINIINENINKWHGTLNIISEDQLEILNDNEKFNYLKKYQNIRQQYGFNCFVGLMIDDNKVLLNNKEIISLKDYYKHKNYLNKGCIFLVKKINNEYFTYQKPLIEGSVIIMDGEGKILSMVGSNDYNLSTFNRVLKTSIQVSSIMKILIFAFLIENGLTPETIVQDEPVTINYNNNIWSPKNWDQKFMGPISLKQAAILSRNCAIINSVLMVDNWQIKLKKFFYKLGIFNFVPSFIIGSNEMTLNDLALLFTPFINNGYLVEESSFIEEIIDDNNVVYNHHQKNKKILSSEVISKTISTFQENNINGLSKNLKINLNFATKSGTANNNSRFNFIGFTNEYFPKGLIIICTVANDNNNFMKGGYSNSSAGIIVSKIIKEILNNLDNNQQ